MGSGSSGSSRPPRSTRVFGTKRQQKDVETLIEEIKKELDIVNYYDFLLTVENDKVIILHFINPYVLEQYHDNLLVKENMDTILKKLRCTSFKVQTREFENKEPRTPPKKQDEIDKTPRTPPKKQDEIDKTPRTEKRQNKKRRIPDINLDVKKRLGKRSLFKKVSESDKNKVQTSIKDYLIRQRNRSGSNVSDSSNSSNNVENKIKLIVNDEQRPRSFSNVSDGSNFSDSSTSTVGDYKEVVSQSLKYREDLETIEEEKKEKMVRQNTQQELREITGQYGKKRKKKKVRSKKKPIKKSKKKIKRK